MIAKELAKQFGIAATRNFGNRDGYILDNVYAYKRDAARRVKDLRSMGWWAALVTIKRKYATGYRKGGGVRYDMLPRYAVYYRPAKVGFRRMP